MGFMGAMRGMRNPMDSWSRSDSLFQYVNHPEKLKVKLGENDLDLASRLIKAGSCDRKFLRMIHIQCDVIAPMYWWKEFDTYKVGTVANSCSTMHKLGSRPLTIEDFSIDSEVLMTPIVQMDFGAFLVKYNRLISLWKKTESPEEKKEYWRLMIQWLPQSFMQRRTLDFNYETALAIIKQRKNHKLSEWHDFCDMLLELPYMKEFVSAMENKNGTDGQGT